MVQEHFGSRAFIDCPSIGNHRMQRNDANRILVVDSHVVRFSPMQYRAVVMLLPGDGIHNDELIRVVYGDGSVAYAIKSLDKLMYKIREKLRPLELTIVNLDKSGYLLRAMSIAARK
jgi:hypothetical protein